MHACVGVRACVHVHVHVSVHDMVLWCVPMYVVGLIFCRFTCVCVCAWRGGGGGSEWVWCMCMCA